MSLTGWWANNIYYYQLNYFSFNVLCCVWLNGVFIIRFPTYIDQPLFISLSFFVFFSEISMSQYSIMSSEHTFSAFQRVLNWIMYSSISYTDRIDYEHMRDADNPFVNDTIDTCLNRCYNVNMLIFIRINNERIHFVFYFAVSPLKELTTSAKWSEAKLCAAFVRHHSV